MKTHAHKSMLKTPQGLYEANPTAEKKKIKKKIPSSVQQPPSVSYRVGLSGPRHFPEPVPFLLQL